MPKLTEVCCYVKHGLDQTLDQSLIPQIEQFFRSKLPFVNTVVHFDGDIPLDYGGIAVPDIEK